jgi:hypothetical protein
MTEYSLTMQIAEYILIFAIPLFIVVIIAIITPNKGK